ncbi:hypothetical protein LXA43DRAFT_1099485 [Ganoderma leucocontextum]|nr:hypothetical protein LXA43DRAFT_1099485 [Ganoderma leucocontextum]
MRFKEARRRDGSSLKEQDVKEHETRRQKSKQFKQSKKKSSGKGKPCLKPEKLEPYDGCADAQIFYKFVRKMTEYLCVYDVSEDMVASDRLEPTMSAGWDTHSQ